MRKKMLEVLRKKNEYLARCGGYFGIMEADDTMNDLNREEIMAYKEEHPDAVMGLYNPQFGWDRIEEPVSEDKLKNFSCDFVLPHPDSKLRKLVESFRKHSSVETMNQIQERLGKMDALELVWY